MIEFTENNLMPVIRSAEYVLFLFGAGMSVDSGIPDYRSSGGWYEMDGPFSRIGTNGNDVFAVMRQQPELAWGMWGFRQNLCSLASPHAGYLALAREAAQKPFHCFVLTSNIDGLTLSAGFFSGHVHECNGSLSRLQCSIPCCRETWPMPEERVEIDAATFQAQGSLPRCPFCKAPARPNIYCFGDSEKSYVWEGTQATVEIGCGLYYSALQRHSEQYLADYPRSRLVRINDSAVSGPSERFIGIQGKAVDVLCGVEA
jgi:NAD-dependent SIR2 family protein deacetylase